MKNTFTLKPLDRLVCAKLRLSYIYKLSAPQENGKKTPPVFNLTRELFFDGFTVRVQSLNLKVGKSECRPKAVEFLTS